MSIFFGIIIIVISVVIFIVVVFISTSAQRVGFFNIGSGRVLEKIPGSGSGLGRVGVLKYTIGYFRVSFLLSGISGYSWVLVLVD